MKINTIILKNMCSKLLNALDTDSYTILSEAVELKVENGILSMSVAGDEYAVVITDSDRMGSNEQFRAVVSADVFLKLINQTTTEQVELSIADSTLTLKGNGEYKFPMTYDGDALIEFPDFSIENETNSFTLNSDVLSSILTYNSREFNNSTVVAPIQKMYYIDGEGCITFTSGACVNNFKLPNDVVLLLSKKIVKLFKLFTDSDHDVNVAIGEDNSNGKSLHKLTLKDDTTCVTCLINNGKDMVDKVPKDTIREMADKEYPYCVTLSKHDMLGILNRMGIFMSTKSYEQHYAYFEFGEDGVEILDKNRHNIETLKYNKSVSDISDSESVILDLYDVKSAVEAIKTDTFSIHFGDHKAVVFKHSNISNIIPECDI